jgi:N-acyl-D-amino-acid deacylase
LDSAILPLLEKTNLVPKKIIDPRVKYITIKHLLQHSGGVDRTVSGDPVFMPILADISRRQNSTPVTCGAIAKDMLEGRLDFTPGTSYAYSNVGYCVLGKIIEAVTGDSFQAYVSRELLMPSIGKSYVTGRSVVPFPEEAHYHMMGAEKVLSAPGVESYWVDAPYGSYSIENMEAFGAWVASPSDVLKFFLAIDGVRGTALLNKTSIEAMQERPTYSKQNDRSYYGLGFQIAEGPKGKNWFHFGSQPGVQSLALRAYEGNSWVVVFNARPKDPKFTQDFDQALWRAYGSTSNIPKEDLFN